MQRKIRVESPSRWRHHRYGWAPCIDRLRALLELDAGTLCVDTEEKIMLKSGGRVIREDFILISHLAPVGHPRWPDWNLRAFACDPNWLASRKHCRGVIALTSYAAGYAAELLGVRSDHVLHPTETPSTLFSFSEFLAVPKPELVMLGWWLRRFSTLAKVRTSIFTKRYVPGRYDAESVDVLLHEEGNELPEGCSITPYLPNDEFDWLLARSIVLLDFHDTSANNSVVECVARRTPLLVRKISSVEEYLGPEYPLYFESLEEAEAKLHNTDLIYRAHEYLGQSAVQAKIDLNTFAERFARTRIYYDLPTGGGQQGRSSPLSAQLT